MMTLRRNPFIALVAAIVMVAAACSSGSTGLEATSPPANDPDTSAPAEEPAPQADEDSDDGTAADPEPEAEGSAPEASGDDGAAAEPEPDDEPPGENQLPDVDVIDLATGDQVSLASFAPADRPIVLWFWAPH